jgi:predicted  nucleic acid-binding Zn-ribbon protein
MDISGTIRTDFKMELASLVGDVKAGIREMAVEFGKGLASVQQEVVRVDQRAQERFHAVETHVKAWRAETKLGIEHVEEAVGRAEASVQQVTQRLDAVDRTQRTQAATIKTVQQQVTDMGNVVGAAQQSYDEAMQQCVELHAVAAGVIDGQAAQQRDLTNTQARVSAVETALTKTAAGIEMLTDTLVHVREQCVGDTRATVDGIMARVMGMEEQQGAIMSAQQELEAVVSRLTTSSHFSLSESLNYAAAGVATGRPPCSPFQYGSAISMAGDGNSDLGEPSAPSVAETTVEAAMHKIARMHGSMFSSTNTNLKLGDAQLHGAIAAANQQYVGMARTQQVAAATLTDFVGADDGQGGGSAAGAAPRARAQRAAQAGAAAVRGAPRGGAPALAHMGGAAPDDGGDDDPSDDSDDGSDADGPGVGGNGAGDGNGNGGNGVGNGGDGNGNGGNDGDDGGGSDGEPEVGESHARLNALGCEPEKRKYYTASGLVLNKQAISAVALQACVPTIVLASVDDLPQIPLACQNKWAAFVGTCQDSYTKVNRGKAPILRSDVDCACRFAEQLTVQLSQNITVPDWCTDLVLRRKAQQFTQNAQAIGSELQAKFTRSEGTDKELYEAVYGTITQHFAEQHIDRELEKMDRYCVAPGPCKVAYIRDDLQARWNTIRTLNHGERRQTLADRFKRGIGSMVRHQCGELALHSGLRLMELDRDPNRYNLEQIFEKLHEAREATVTVRAHDLAWGTVFDPRAMPSSTKQKQPTKTQQQPQVQSGRPVQQQKFGGLSASEYRLRGDHRLMAAMHASKGADQVFAMEIQQPQGLGCPMCGTRSAGHRVYGPQCRPSFDARRWGEYVRRYPAMGPWAPHSENDAKALMAARRMDFRQTRELEQQRTGGGGTGVQSQPGSARPLRK